MTDALAPLVHKDDVALAVEAALFALPLDDGSLAKLAPVKKDMDWHGEGESLRADVHAPILDKVFRHFVHEGRQTPGWHKSHSLRSYSEQSKSGPQPALRFHELISVIDGLTDSSRRVEERVSRCASATRLAA